MTTQKQHYKPNQPIFMKKLLLSLAVALSAFTLSAAPVTVDFSTADGLPTAESSTASTATIDGVEFSFVNCKKGTYNKASYLQISGKNYEGNAYMEFKLTEPCEKFTITTGSNASIKVTVQLTANGEKIGESVLLNATSGNFTWTIPAANQAAGTVYRLATSNKYNSQITKIVFNGEGGETPVDPVDPSDLGSAENPCSVTEALNAASALADGKEINAVAKGTIKSIKEISTQFGNATYTITDGTSDLSVFRGNGLNGEKFTSDDAIKVGDEVVVSGKLVNYKGNTPQFTTGSKILSINGGEVPEVKTVDYTDIAAFLAAANTTDQSRITGATTAVYQNGRYLWLKDNSGVVLAYNGGDIEMPKFANGQTVEGGITGKYQNFSEGQLQMSNLVAGTFKAGAQGAAVEAELIQVEEVATDLVNTYVRFEGVTVTEGTAANNYVMSDASGEIALYNQFNDAKYYDVVKVATGTNLTVYGFVAIHSGNLQIMPVKVTSASGKEVVAAPTFNPAAGAVAEGTEVTITCATEGATIYYTTDGTNPTAASSVYSTPVVINEALTLKALAVKEGMDDSAIATAEYTIKAQTPVTGNEAMFNFAEPTTLDPSYKAEGTEQSYLVAEVPNVTFTNNGISVVSTGGSSTARLWKCGTQGHGVEYRVYNGATTTISAQEGMLIKAVEFTGAQLTALQQNGVVLNNATEATWTSAEGVSKVVFDCVTNGTYKRADIATMKVVFEKSSQGIADVELGEEAPAEYYNLQGVRMNGELAPGLYIRRQGNKATKVVVK